MMNPPVLSSAWVDRPKFFLQEKFIHKSIHTMIAIDGCRIEHFIEKLLCSSLLFQGSRLLVIGVGLRESCLS